MGNCFECNKNEIDYKNMIGKIQITKEEKINKQNKDNNSNSGSGNLSALIDIQQSNNDRIRKCPDSQIPINPPKVPHDRIPDNIIESKRKLKLIIVQSKYLTEGKELIINAGGLIGSLRNAKDGITIFGDAYVNHIYININLNIIQNNQNNDFEFPEEESKTGQSHAKIKYNINLDQYQIKSLRGSGCFLKINKRIVKLNFFLIFLYSYQKMEIYLAFQIF